MRSKEIEQLLISTHVPHKRYDGVITAANAGVVTFQLTYLTRGTTGSSADKASKATISTHVPHKRYNRQ